MDGIAAFDTTDPANITTELQDTLSAVRSARAIAQRLLDSVLPTPQNCDMPDQITPPMSCMIGTLSDECRAEAGNLSGMLKVIAARLGVEA